MLMTFNTFSEVSIADLLDEQVLLPCRVHALSLAAACAATEVWLAACQFCLFCSSQERNQVKSYTRRTSSS